MSTHPEPLYRMIEDHLRAEIATGKHGVGDLLPSGGYAIERAG
jgi:DNA-binding GntR family transcriptional regulator